MSDTSALVIYESLTGNTRRTAGLIAAELTAAGIRAGACPVDNIDAQALSAADLVIIGSWVDGVFVVGQRPGRAGRLRAMPYMTGKRCLVYCTYALNPGRTIDKLTAIVEDRGGEVLGGLAIRRNELEAGAERLVAGALGAVKP